MYCIRQNAPSAIQMLYGVVGDRSDMYCIRQNAPSVIQMLYGVSSNCYNVQYRSLILTYIVRITMGLPSVNIVV